VETTEKPFIPGQKKVSVVLQPIPGEEVYYPPEAPVPEIPPGFALEIPKLMPEAKPLVINIETTGIYPFNSRITNIGCLDPSDPDNPVFFFDVDEEKMLKEFLSWFESRGYNQLVGYNVSFDYRFLFAKCLRYRIQVPVWPSLDLLDLAQIMQQVKQAFVFGYNKPGTLDAWTEYLFGIRPPMTQKEAMEAFEKKKYDLVRGYNEYKVVAAYSLYTLILYVEGGQIV